MTTINAIEDLLQILRENDEMRSAVRRELLTEDLLDLPRQFGVFQETQTSALEELADLRKTQNSMLETQNAMLRRLDNIETHNGRLSQDFGTFRGNYAESAAVKNATGIALLLNEARDLGLDETAARVLSGDELRALAREYGSDRLSAVPLDDRRSHYGADLVIEAAGPDGSTCYIAVEASHTCDSRDTDRAISNADLLAEFTGLDAWPAIAGVRVDRNIRPLIDSDEVFWYRLEEVDMELSEPN